MIQMTESRVPPFSHQHNFLRQFRDRPEHGMTFSSLVNTMRSDGSSQRIDKPHRQTVSRIGDA
eukprot:scaffold90822_cov27-Prasinocladus_malaysianus.AAC.1